MRLSSTLIVLALWMTAGTVQAQELPEPPQVQLVPPRPHLVPPEALRRGQAAPRDGLFVEPPTYLGLTRHVDDLEFLLARTVRMETDRCEARIERVQVRLQAANETLELHDSLWESRQAELATSLAEARRSAERGWWENDVLWLTIGVAAGGIITGALAAALN